MKLPKKTILTVLTLVSFSPILSLLTAGVMASALGCQLDEGSQHPCYLAGVDIGGPLYVGAVAGWFMFATWPGMLLCAAAWAFLLVRWVVRRLASRFRSAWSASLFGCAGSASGKAVPGGQQTSELPSKCPGSEPDS